MDPFFQLLIARKARGLVRVRACALCRAVPCDAVLVLCDAVLLCFAVLLCCVRDAMLCYASGRWGGGGVKEGSWDRDERFIHHSSPPH